jgi:hypothetical protein
VVKRVFRKKKAYGFMRGVFPEEFDENEGRGSADDDYGCYSNVHD